MRFWEDVWAIKDPLLNYVSQSLPQETLQVPICCLLNSALGWIRDRIEPFPTTSVLVVILQQPLFGGEENWDQPIWHLLELGLFTTRSIRKMFQSTSYAPVPFNWDRIYQFKGPTRVSFT